MNRLKSQTKFLKIFTVFLLILFVASKTAAFLHGISHLPTSAEVVAKKSFIDDLIFNHSKNHSLQSCVWLAFSVANSFLPLITAALFLFYSFKILSRFFERIKFSYLLSSYYSQAPPSIS